MIKKILSVFALMCSVASVFATAKYVTVEQLNGNKYSFLLKDNPVISYVRGDLVVNGNVATSYAISGVKDYHFTESDQSGVEKVSAEMLSVVSLDESTMEVLNAPATSEIVLVSATGAVMASATTDENGTAMVGLPNQKGVYVLCVGNQSFKVIRK